MRHEFVQNLRALFCQFVVRTFFIYQRKCLRVAPLRQVEALTIPIQFAESQQEQSLFRSRFRRFRASVLIRRDRSCRIASSQVDIAHCIINLVEIIFVLIGPRH